MVLAAGAIGSAQLLMVSGVGPKDHLDDIGIYPTIADLPVGYNLQDHVTFSGNAFIINQTGMTMNDVSLYFYTMSRLNNERHIGTKRRTWLVLSIT